MAELLQPLEYVSIGQPGNCRDQKRNACSFRGKKRPGLCVTFFTVILLFGNGFQIQSQDTKSLSDIEAEIIPAEGQMTAYGFPLSLNNTQLFIDYHKKIDLTPEQNKVRRLALTKFKAPCCDEFTADTCCCSCNLFKSVWGLTKFLIAKKNFSATQTAESVLEWLQYVRSDYYIVQELIKRGISPGKHNLKKEDSCFVGKCELPFVEGGCGGMRSLRM